MPAAPASSSIVTWPIGLSRKTDRAASIRACSRWSPLVGARRLFMAGTPRTIQPVVRNRRHIFFYRHGVEDGTSFSPVTTKSRLALPVACYVVLLVSALQTLVVPVVGDIQE